MEEIDFDMGCSVRIVSDVQGLIRSSSHYERTAFIVGRAIVRRPVPSLITSTFSARINLSLYGETTRRPRWARGTKLFAESKVSRKL